MRINNNDIEENNQFYYLVHHSLLNEPTESPVGLSESDSTLGGEGADCCLESRRSACGGPAVGPGPVKAGAEAGTRGSSLLAP